MEQRFGIKRIATRSTRTEKRHVVMFEFAENSNSKYSVASLNIPEWQMNTEANNSETNNQSARDFSRGPR